MTPLGAASEEAQLAAAEAADGSGEPDPQDLLTAEVAARANQPNLSFFAFTATPKARTLELFGRLNEEGRYVPFHLYSMRQAIEEEFILDVLANYTTYATYWKVEKAVAEDPSTTPRRRAGRSPASCHCTRTTWRRRPRSSSSTSEPTLAGRSAARARPWS